MQVHRSRARGAAGAAGVLRRDEANQSRWTAILGSRESPPSPAPDTLAALGLAGALVVDVRAPDRFARAHVPGTLNIPWGGSFTTLAGSLLPYGHDVYLLAEDRATALAAARALSLIGLDRISGFFDE